MIECALEFIHKIASNSLFMFFFCNLIIFLILMANSKLDPLSGSKFRPEVTSRSTLSSKPGFGAEPSQWKPGLEIEGSNPVCKAIETGDEGKEQKRTYQESLSSKPGFRAKTSQWRPGLEIEGSSPVSKAMETGDEQRRRRMIVTTSELTFQPVSSKGVDDEMDATLRRRVEEFIDKVNSQWKWENSTA
ncbi:PREDICTED: uncharacterized protein LOC109116475 [Tarenaya hassleriana]|uniref:uncharacterized protein LOC109116475 n=1 Tax=Tarenaya hassleriana TaxID=28532 RepID=UPI0008FD1CCA|nr:PREDICTED: uncharacterized protein LOC109116475 [Tarenaya hassleriana]